MSYKIVVDSCGELPVKLKEDGHFQTVSLELFVDDYHVVDDESFDQKEFLQKVKESPNCPKSACPSPESYEEAYDCEAEHVYAVTLSAQLSGSYNSAELGRKLYLEEKGEKQIHVFDSKSASFTTITALVPLFNNCNNLSVIISSYHAAAPMILFLLYYKYLFFSSSIVPLQYKKKSTPLLYVDFFLN